MSALQPRERVLAQLGVRAVTVRAGDSLEHAVATLGIDAGTLAQLITVARRDGADANEALGVCAWADGESVTLLSTSSLRSDALAWAGVAHELRNALTTIAGWAQVAAQTRDDERARHAVEMVQASALDAMDVAPLLLAQRTQGESTDVERTLRHVVERFAPIAAARDVRLACRRIDGGEVATSRAALSSIVANLVKNAIEACEPKGRVDVGARTTNRGIELIVEDDGRGMDESALRERFDAAGLNAESARTGRGVGLSVVRALVARAGGTSRVTSRVGAGSCVRIELPVTTKSSASSGVRARSAARRVLLVEDHAALSDLVESTLTARGATVFATREPARALAAAREERFDVALVDLDLGETSGASLVRTLVSTRLARRVVIMTGASAVPDLGADAVLRKPFDLADVEEIAIESTRVAKNSSTGKAIGSGSPSALAGKKRRTR